MRVDRAFVTVADREVHYRRVGAGPPALFIHSSPANCSFVIDDMLALADSSTCFAFDTPGFGLSDPLAGTHVNLTDLADATAKAIGALGIGPLPVYGTHTGAAIALELGYRHPEMVTALVLNGVPIFTREEVASLGDAYFTELDVDILGGHFSAIWTRFRDQSIWFPWRVREPGNLNPYDLSTPEATHSWAEAFYAAAEHYIPAYSGAIGYCEGAIEAARGLARPAIFTASATDMLHPHLARLPALGENQTIAEFGTDPAAMHDLIRTQFRRHPAGEACPPREHRIAGNHRVVRQFLPDGDRQQMIRTAGANRGEATLVLHDLPGSSLMIRHRIEELGRSRFVLAPDLPGCGESGPLDASAELGGYAAAMWRLCDAAGLSRLAIEGHGLGASLAVEMAKNEPERATSLAIDGLLLPDADERAQLLANYAPPIAIERDGAHWYRTWLMLRDSLVYWPWYDTRVTAAHRADTQFDAQMLHDRTVETMKQREGYARLIHAVLRHDAARALARSRIPVTRIDDPRSILGKVYGERLGALIAARTG